MKILITDFVGSLLIDYFGFSAFGFEDHVYILSDLDFSYTKVHILEGY